MNTMTHVALQADLSAVISQVVNDRTPVIIRKKKEAVVMMNLDDYTAWAETVYLLRSPQNAKRLTASLAAVENNDTIAKSLSELLDE